MNTELKIPSQSTELHLRHRAKYAERQLVQTQEKPCDEWVDKVCETEWQTTAEDLADTPR